MNDNAKLALLGFGVSILAGAAAAGNMDEAVHQTRIQAREPRFRIAAKSSLVVNGLLSDAGFALGCVGLYRGGYKKTALGLGFGTLVLRALMSNVGRMGSEKWRRRTDLALARPRSPNVGPEPFEQIFAPPPPTAAGYGYGPSVVPTYPMPDW